MILVTGATGYIGRHVVQRLLDEGWPVRCLLPERRLKRLPWQSESLPEIITGNVLNEEILFQAVTGVHAVIHLESAQWWGRMRDLERVELVGTRNLVAVARAARVGRIITLSHLGATPSSAFTLLKIKGMLEDLLRSSGLAYTILRPGVVFGPGDAFVTHIAMMLRLNPLFFLMPGQGEVVLNPLYIDDLVEAIYRSLSQIETVDATLEIGGPEYLTLEDLIRTVMRVTGQYRPIFSVPPYVMRWATAFYSRVLPRSLMTQQWLDILAASRTAHLGNMYTYFGLHPRRFEDTLLTYLPQQPFLLPALRYSLRRRPRGI
ncbi:MAG: NAD(P)H-binding protein [bacterium]|nr:NAD(P)H-binding protein [bacterium]